jgi:threonine dehydrogenase-like Zn-dependent dehydrogenase
MISDIFATSWAALDYAGFNLGDTMAVFRAGLVSLIAIYLAIL